MVEKIKKVSNPLTIIAIFATLAEVSGTIVLPFIDSDIQKIYIYYLIGFPSVLVILFFLTLNFNYKVLYSPSDFDDEKNFMTLIKPSSKKDKMKKAIKEAKEIIESEPITESKQGSKILGETINSDAIINKINKSSIENEIDQFKRNPSSKNNFINDINNIENLAIKKYLKTHEGVFSRDVTFHYANNKMIFDGMLKNRNDINFVEVKVLKSFSRGLIKNIIEKYILQVEKISNISKNSTFMLDLIIVIIENNFELKDVDVFMNSNNQFFFDNINTSVYKYSDLQKK